MAQRTILAVMLLVIISALDGARDALFGRTDWWTWHLIKWAAFYPPLAWIAIREIGLRLWLVPVALGSWCAWQMGLVMAGSPWKPTIQRIWEMLYE